MSSIRKQSGVNLLELVISMSIVCSFTVIAAPSFSDILESKSTEIAARQITRSLYLARNTALTEIKNVHVCRKTADQQCHTNYPFNADWSNGWLVFIDNNKNANYDSEDTLIHSVNNTHDTKIIFNQRGRLRYFPSGFSRSAGFYICSKNKKYFRHVLMLHTGRVRMSKTLTNTQKSKCN